MSFPNPAQNWNSLLSICSNTSAPSTALTMPTSAPQPSKAVPERKAKLRASCDACAASKVKCSKEKPICARCLSSGSQCIYGVSRKHGKPGRTRKRNPDGSPFIKASKQRPSPDGSEFGKFRVRVRAEPLLPDVSSMETTSWPSTPEWPATPEFKYNMMPEPAYTEDEVCFMDDTLMGNAQTAESSWNTPEPKLTFRDPFLQEDSMQLDLPPPDFEALKNLAGSHSVDPFDCDWSEPSADSYFPAADTPPESPKGSSSYLNPLRATSIAMPISGCCYSIAYSVLESLQFQTPETGGAQLAELKSLDSVLCVTKTAVQGVTKLLSCPCAADPHLAMLYSSITSKIITWYQIAAGLKLTPFNAPSTPALSTISSSSFASSSALSSPLPTPSPTFPAFNIKLQPLKIGQFEFDEADQEALRRQIVTRELKKCGVLVEALANWRRGAEAEQAEFLYNILGSWLKSELYKTMRDIVGEQE